LQGTFTGINAGLGNLGVSAAQRIVPFMASNGLCSPGKSGTCDGSVIGGKYAYNIGLFWVIVLSIAAVLAFRLTNDQPGHGHPEGRTLMNVQYYLRIWGVGYGGGVVAGLLLYATNSAVAGIPAAIIVRALFLAFFSASSTTIALFTVSRGWVWEATEVPLAIKTYHSGQQSSATGKKFALIRDSNTIILTLLYIMTFASFIGYVGAFPKMITEVYGKYSDGSKNPDAPLAADYSYLGAFVGSLARAVAGPISDYTGGSVLTAIAMTFQITATLGLSIIARVTLGADDRLTTFTPFVIVILILFIGTGLGNCSVFKQIGMLYEPMQRGPVLGFTAACAAYGAFVVPTLVGAGITGGYVDVVFYVFCTYYGFCGFLNYWYYFRRNAEFPC